ncbi:hypothetical protein BC332_11003 [Capsicum chinense]|nr:hypothetical protein BC332_11003 [Capsicum chinense]
MKKNLVNALVGTLTGSWKRKRAVKLVEDSELFQDGTIGESSSGGKLSTYNELCNLANEIGQLIYKFMDLANYQASLNSKREATFGFSKIAKHAGDALQRSCSKTPSLSRIPILAITRGFLSSASDVIQGRKFDQVEKHLKRMTTAYRAYRAMDDIKESVRNSGIMSKVESIRKASIGVVTKLTKGAAIALRPHLPDLVCCMLESLSSLEDQGSNCVELHAANVGIQTEKLENLCISIAKGSPMWETLDRCIDVIDSQSVELLVPRVAQLVQVSVDYIPGGKEKRAFANACATILKYATPSQAH